MSVWAGWQVDLLSHSGIPNTTENRQFLTEWHQNAQTNCHDNPIDLSVQSAGSSNCHSLPAITARAQNYATTGDAVHAFDVQIHQNAYKALLAAMMTGDPYTANNTGQAAQDLTAWGSAKFARVYFADTANAPGRGGTGGTISTPHAHKGWNDIRKSVNHHLPAALRHSNRQMIVALHALSRTRKVKI